MARSGAALSFAVLLAVLEIGNCLRCYQCNSQSSKDCGDPINVNKLHLVDCMTDDAINYNRLYLSIVLPQDVLNAVRGAPRYCHKLVMKNGAVVRTCLETNPSNLNTTCQFLGEPTRNLNDAVRQVTHCSVCDKEACNGAGAMALSLPLAFITFFVTYLYCKH